MLVIFLAASPPLGLKLQVLTTQVYYCTTYCSTLLPGAFGYGAPWWPWNGAGRRRH